jgi:hypothetical protein
MAMVTAEDGRRELIDVGTVLILSLAHRRAREKEAVRRVGTAILTSSWTSAAWGQILAVPLQVL